MFQYDKILTITTNSIGQNPTKRDRKKGYVVCMDWMGFEIVLSKKDKKLFDDPDTMQDVVSEITHKFCSERLPVIFDLEEVGQDLFTKIALQTALCIGREIKNEELAEASLIMFANQCEVSHTDSKALTDWIDTVAYAVNLLIKLSEGDPAPINEFSEFWSHYKDATVH